MFELYNFQIKQCLVLLSTFFLFVDSAAVHPKSISTHLNKLKHSESSINNNMKIVNESIKQDMIAELRSNEPNIFYGESFGKISPNFENIPASFIGPNYAIGKYGTNYDQNNIANKLVRINTLNKLAILSDSQLKQQQQLNVPQKDDTMNDILTTTFKKYDVKKYLLKKILGNFHELDEDEGGFFSNKHLKRHGTAGMAAKVIGELIGIKIRESIEGLGKSFSEYAKDFTARNFVTLGQLFGRFFKAQ